MSMSCEENSCDLTVTLITHARFIFGIFSRELSSDVVHPRELGEWRLIIIPCRIDYRASGSWTSIQMWWLLFPREIRTYFMSCHLQWLWWSNQMHALSCIVSNLLLYFWWVMSAESAIENSARRRKRILIIKQSFQFHKRERPMSLENLMLNVAKRPSLKTQPLVFFFRSQ